VNVLIVEAALAAAAWLISQIKTRVEWDEVVAWFQSHEALKRNDTNNVAFTLMQPAGAKVKFIQGIFNKTTNTVLDGRVWTADSLDERLLEAHRRSELVVYE
jgi:hypothetical protein